MMAVYLKSIYLYALARREIYIEIPMEAWQPGDEARVAKLNLSLYGTLDAAQNLTEEYTKQVTKLGFATGVAMPCNFVHEAREPYVTVHGDDFIVGGQQASLQLFKASMKEFMK